MSDGEYKTIDQKVGLLGGTVLLTGTVIGISVFLLPGELIAEAGPGIFPALILTSIPMGFAVLTLLQLGGAIPVAGGLYVYASRLLGPFWGFLTIWLMVPCIWSVLLFTSIGFADFTQYFFPELSQAPLMVVILVGFLLLNLRGINIVTQVQLVMVLGILLGMIVFIVPGVPHVDTANYSPVFVDGPMPFLVAMVSLYIPFQGFTMIIELGEELENPVKNIPRVLGLGMVFSVVFSVALVGVFVGVAPYEQHLQISRDGRVAEAALLYLPEWGGAIVALAAIMGAFTTINALLTSYSRTIMRAARDELVPSVFAELHPVSNVPYWPIVILGLPPILIAPVSPEAVPLTIFLALILLFANAMAGVALWRLPKVFPQRYEYSIYKLPMPLLKVTSVAITVVSTVFWIGVLTQLPEIVALIVTLVIVGYVVYRYRIAAYEKRGIDLKQKMSLLHDHEQSGGSSGSSGD